jgi:hypothetical protein
MGGASITKKGTILANAAVISVTRLAGPTAAQVAPQTVEIAEVDVQKVAAGYRASKVIGSNVINGANDALAILQLGYHYGDRDLVEKVPELLTFERVS